MCMKKYTTIVPRKLTFCDRFSTSRNNCPFVGAQVSTYSRMLGLPVPSSLVWPWASFFPNSRARSRRLGPPTVASYWLDLPCPVSLAVDEHPPPQNRMDPRSHWPRLGNDVRSFLTGRSSGCLWVFLGVRAPSQLAWALPKPGSWAWQSICSSKRQP